MRETIAQLWYHPEAMYFNFLNPFLHFFQVIIIRVYSGSYVMIIIPFKNKVNESLIFNTFFENVTEISIPRVIVYKNLLSNLFRKRVLDEFFVD